MQSAGIVPISRVGCGAEGIRTPVQANSNNFIGNVFNILKNSAINRKKGATVLRSDLP